MKRLRDLTAVLGMVALTACNNASIEGSWVEPVPGMPGMQQGFVLDGDGSASSINMATLKYEAWKKVGNRLLLSGTSIGNHQNISFTDTLTIEKLTQDSLILKRGELLLRYAKTNFGYLVPALGFKKSFRLIFLRCFSLLPSSMTRVSESLHCWREDREEISHDTVRK